MYNMFILSTRSTFFNLVEDLNNGIKYTRENLVLNIKLYNFLRI